MKKLIGHDIGTYAFNPTAKTITLYGVPSMSLEQILTVTNTTQGTPIYSFVSTALSGSYANSVLTLAYNTSGSMLASDSLQIYVDLPEYVDTLDFFTGSITVTGPGPNMDTTGFQSIVMQFEGQWDGAIYIEGSNDLVSGSWEGLFAMSMDDMAPQDIIDQNGIYVIKSSTQYMRYNVAQLMGIASASIIGRRSEGGHAADRLAFALDQSTGVALSVAVQNQLVDAMNAIVVSDAPRAWVGMAAKAGQPLVTVDTMGYQSVACQIGGIWTGTVTFQASNDGGTWFSVAGWSSAAPALAAVSTTANALFSIPAVGRYFRPVFTTATTGQPTCVIFLRASAASPMLATPSVSANVATWAGTAGPSAGVAGMVAVGGNVAAGTASLEFPVLMGGVSPSTTSSLATVVRRLVVDQYGNLVISGVPAPSNYQFAIAVPTMDVNMHEGDRQIDVLANVLTELRIMNQYLSDLPWQLQVGTSFYNDPPERFRNDPSFYTI